MDETRDLSGLEESLDYRFSDRGLLETALRHRSYTHEQSTKTDDNERFEFLGDAVLNSVISHILMARFPNLTEGELSKVRASLVNESRLATVARSICLGDYVQLGRGESKSRGARKKSILSDALEAILAAVYIDGGYARAFELIRSMFAPHLEEIEKTPPIYDYKSLLQELVQNHYQDIPIYRVSGSEGPDHDKTFQVSLSVCGMETTGSGKSKKAAEQTAAKKALDTLATPDEDNASHDERPQTIIPETPR